MCTFGTYDLTDAQAAAPEVDADLALFGAPQGPDDASVRKVDAAVSAETDAAAKGD